MFWLDSAQARWLGAEWWGLRGVPRFVAPTNLLVNQKLDGKERKDLGTERRFKKSLEAGKEKSV
jgi:hypothetical protein